MYQTWWKKKHEKKHKITCRAMWGVKCKVFFSGIRLPLPLLPPDFGGQVLVRWANTGNRQMLKQRASPNDPYFFASHMYIIERT